MLRSSLRVSGCDLAVLLHGKFAAFHIHLDEVSRRETLCDYGQCERILQLPFPLRYLLAAHPQLLSPVLQITHRAISTFVIKQAGLNQARTATGAVTLIQRYESAANLDIYQNIVWSPMGSITPLETCRCSIQYAAPAVEQLHILLHQAIKRYLK